MLKAQEAPVATVSPIVSYQKAVELHRSGRLAEAKAMYEQLVAQRPDLGDAWFGIGTIYAQQASSADAIICFERAMALMGPRPEIHHNMAAAKSALGRMTEAEVHYREAIRLKPDYYEAYFNFAHVRKFKNGGPIVQSVEELLTRPDLTPVDRCFLHFAAGKLHDDLSEPAKAFPHYLEGNAAKPTQFDAQAVYDEIAGIAQAFDASRLQALKGLGNPDERIVLVVGMPRSGTTLVEQVIASHPQAEGAGELPALSQTARAIGEHYSKASGTPVTYPGFANRLDSQVLNHFGGAYANHLAEQAGPRGTTAARIVDKTPLNFRHLGLAQSLLPNVKIIHCRRHPLDTCLSCFFQNFRSGQDYSFDLQTLGFYYGQYHWLMGHWARCGVPVFDLNYADFVGNIEDGARRLLDFIGLEWNPVVLDFHETNRNVQTASRAQVRRPVYTSSVGRWQAYDPYLGPLKEALQQARVPLDQ